MPETFIPPARWPAGYMRAGASVEVRSSFEGSWCHGFEIAEVVLEKEGVAGYRLRRQSDGTVLPAVFPLDDIIPASH